MRLSGFLVCVTKVICALVVSAAVAVGTLISWAWFDHDAETTLPRPSGQYSVGRTQFHLLKSAPTNSTTPVAATSTELMVWIWYPASANSGETQPADYLPAPWREAIAQHSGWLMTHLVSQDLAQVHAHAVADAEWAVVDSTFPVVLMRPGLAALAVDYTTLAEDLASHGYVVVGFDAPYRSRVVVMPDGRVISRSPKNNADVVDGPALDAVALRLITAWVADTGVVLDELARLNEKSMGGTLAGRLNLARVAVIGHSLGGATSAQFCHDDARCKVGIDIDGALFGTVVRDGLKQPFMFLGSDHQGEDDAFSKRTYIDLKSVFDRLPPESRSWLMIRGANHYGFSDSSLVKSHVLVEALERLGISRLSGIRQLEITNHCVSQFLDQHLLSLSLPMPIAPAFSYPELKAIEN